MTWVQLCLVVLPLGEKDRSRYLLTLTDTTHRHLFQLISFLENERQGLAATVQGDLCIQIGTRHELLTEIGEDSNSLQKPRELAWELVKDSSNLIASLRHPMAENTDIISALKELLTKFHLDTGIEVVSKWPKSAPRLSDQSSLVLYRVVQEGLANIGKHAKASSVGIKLHVNSHWLKAELVDNGLGFDLSMWSRRSCLRRHFGLASMRERSSTIGANFRLHSQIGVGTRLNLDIPLQDPLSAR